jgi:hypothetical protein
MKSEQHMAATRAKNMKRTVVRVCMGVGRSAMNEGEVKKVSASAMDNHEVPRMDMGTKKSARGRIIRRNPFAMKWTKGRLWSTLSK